MATASKSELKSTPLPPRGSFLSRPGLVSMVSLLAIVGMCLLLWAPWERRGKSGPLRLYCAAGMAEPIKKLLHDFEEATGQKVEVSYGGSGGLLANIRAASGQGDLYLSADASHIDKARELGLIDEVIPLGRQRPVLVVSKGTFAKLDKEGKPIRALADLLRKDLKVVIANPEIASIGQLSREIFRKHGMWKQIEADLADPAARVSTAGTVNEVVTAVRGGERTVGIVWRPNAEHKELVKIDVEELSGYSEPVLLAVLKKSSDPAGALTLARFLQAKDRGGEVFAAHKYEAVKDADAWDARPVLRISAGAMLKPVLDPLVRRFEEREGVEIQTKYAGCGILVTEMKSLKGGAGAPDAFFACEVSFLEQVQDWFEAGTLIAENDVVLVVSKKKEAEVKTLDDLTMSDLRVGLGDPEKSALGAITDKVLVKLELKKALERPGRTHPVVYQPEAALLIAQLRSGAVDAVVVYRSSVLSAPGAEEHMTIVESAEPRAIARQPFAIAQKSPHKKLLERFRDMLMAEDSAGRFREKGFRWLGAKAKTTSAE